RFRGPARRGDLAGAAAALRVRGADRERPGTCVARQGDGGVSAAGRRGVRPGGSDPRLGGRRPPREAGCPAVLAELSGRGPAAVAELLGDARVSFSWSRAAAAARLHGCGAQRDGGASFFSMSTFCGWISSK